jgi:hypothetical protein
MSPSRRSERVTPSGPGPAWGPIALWAAIFTLLGAAAIHAGQVSEHLEEWRPAGLTFIALAGLETVIAIALLVRRSRPLYMGGIGVSLATIALWATSRAVGIPFGPEAWEPEPVGRPDVLASSLELATVVALLPIARTGRTVDAGHGRPVTFLSIAVIGLLVASLSWLGVQGSHGACVGHDVSDSLTGPLLPTDGHSILGRKTPPVQAQVGERFGLVVGLLRNCGEGPATIREAELIGSSDQVIVGSSFWVVPPELARPGVPITLSELRGRGRPLPGAVGIPPLGPTGPWGLVMEVHAAVAGRSSINGVRVVYESEGRSYVAPFATVALVEVK